MYVCVVWRGPNNPSQIQKDSRNVDKDASCNEKQKCANGKGKRIREVEKVEEKTT